MASSLPTNNDTTAILDHNGGGKFYPGHPLSVDDRSLSLPDCELLTELGSGGMGTVYLARQKHLNRLVAVKAVKLANANDECHADWLRDEAQTMAALNHPNIVSIYDMVQSGDHLFIVMEYVPGRKTVRDLVLRYGPLPLPIVLRILLDVCNGLAYVESKDFIHCDLKPDNILIANEFDSIHPDLDEMFAKPTTRVKICDFGIARHIHVIGVKSDESHRLVLGSPNYMAPEQIRNPDDVDFRADIYSLAGTAFFMLTGEAPFQSNSKEELLDLKLSHSLPSLGHRSGLHLPSRLVSILDKMGRCNAQERYDSYARLISDLDEVNSLLPNTLQASSRTLQKKYWKVKSLLLLILLGVLGVGVFFFNRFIQEEYFRERYISLSSSLGFWNQSGRSGWHVVGRQNHVSSPILVSGKHSGILTLLPRVSPGSTIEWTFRGGGSSSINHFLLDNDLSNFHVSLMWQHQAQDNVNLFAFQSPGKSHSIDDVFSMPHSGWMTAKLVVKPKSILVYLNNELVYVGRFSSIPECLFSLQVDNNSIGFFKDIFIYPSQL